MNSLMNNKDSAVFESLDAPRSPSVTVQPEPRAAWKAQRHMEECVPSLERRGRRKTVALIYGDKGKHSPSQIT